jgi:hypothetical protein
VLLCRELDEAQSSEQEHSFDGQQGMTNVPGGARFRPKRIQQRVVIAPRWLHHVGGVHQRGQKKSRFARRGVVLIERFLDVGKDQLERINRPTDEPLAHRFLKPRYLSLERCAKQRVLGRKAVDETALADSRTLGDGI